jgi:hypothetical protein
MSYASVDAEDRASPFRKTHAPDMKQISIGVIRMLKSVP